MGRSSYVRSDSDSVTLAPVMFNDVQDQILKAHGTLSTR